MISMSFPEGFKWGSAVWALGVEGALDEDGMSPTVLQRHSEEHPEFFFEGVGPDRTLDWRHDYERFAQMAADLGHTSFRVGLLWSRLMPDGEHVSESAVAYYGGLFRAFKDRGMELSVVLYWFDMPVWAEDRGGFTRREIETAFVRYCDTAFRLFDGLVDIWYVYNEPTVDVFMKYAWQVCYPNRVSWTDVCRATYNMVVAHARVVRAFREGGYTGRIGSVMSHSHVYPASDAPADVAAASEDSALVHRCFEDPLLLGRLSREWRSLVERSGVELEERLGDAEVLEGGIIDVIGLNIYAPERVIAGEPLTASAWMAEVLGGNAQAQDPADAERDAGCEPFLTSRPYVWPEAQMNKDRGWEIYPRVAFDSVMDIATRYPEAEIRITENGIGTQDEGQYRGTDGQIDDRYRIAFLAGHIAWAGRAITEGGARLTGYNTWSFVDLWSPSNQFKNCYGLVEYDRATGEIRRKASADWFEGVTRANAVEIPEER